MLAVTLADAERVPHWVAAVVVPPGGVTAQLIGLVKLTFMGLLLGEFGDP
jgi:hypothetical protein